MKKFFEDKENKISFCLFVITMLVAISPLISRYCINGHDLEYHLLRIESLKEGILIGKPFLKVNTLFFGGMGYASSMFYSDLFMYIPAILRVLGLSIGKSYHIYVGLIFILCYLSTYYCTYKMTGSKYMGSLAAVILTLCPYHMDDMLVRGACGEYMAFIFVPFVVYGVYNVLFESMDKPYIFGIGFAGLILSHPATLVLNVVFAIVAFVVFIKRLFADKKIIIRLIITTIVTVLITAFQWLPMLEQMINTKFYVSNDTIDMLDAAVDFSVIFTQVFPAAGILLLIIVIPRIFLSRADNPILVFVDLMLGMGMIFAIGTSNVMPWERVERFLRFIQFPWRLFIMTSTLLSMAGAIIIVLFAQKIIEGKMELALFVVTSLAIALALSHQNENATGYYDYANDYYSYKPYTANVIGGEWLPVAVTDREALVGLSDYMIDSEGNYLDFTRSRAVISGNIAGAEYVDVPFIYYKGYKAKLTEDNGSVRELTVSNEGTNGLCRVYTEGLNGELQVSYAGTSIIHVSAVVSLLTMIFCIGVLVYKRKNHKLLKVNSNLAVLAFLVVSLTSLSGCSSQDLQNVASSLEELNETVNGVSDFNDPDNVVGYLKEKDQKEEAEVEEPEEEINYISFNVSQEGYDKNGVAYAIKVDSENTPVEYEIVDLDAVEDVDFEIKNDMYDKLADEYIARLTVYYDNVDTKSGDKPLNKDELKVAVMQQADILLYLTYHPDGSKAESLKKLANRLAFLLYESSDIDLSDMALSYNCAAVLASSSKVLDDLDFGDDAKKQAIKLWDDAEGINTDDEIFDINRAWAAAELFKATGNKTYRTIVEAISGDVELIGVSFDDPGYYCVFAYLSANGSTSYDISSQMMNGFFEDINSRIKSKREDILIKAIDEDNLSQEELSTDFIDSITDDATIAMMANYISMSVEYTRYTQDRIIFLCGANPTGFNYFADENTNLYDPVLFALCSLCE